MKVGIIGSGGREHAICLSLIQSKNVKKVYCIPGNGGTSKIAKNINIEIDDFEKIKNFFLEEKIDLVVVGPEKPLVDGIVDFLENYNIKVFGPNKLASQLEGSKIFTKKICEKYKIPTAKFGIFKSYQESMKFLEKTNFPIVIKADNLASGKGVYICQNKNESNFAVKEIFDGKFGEARNILIEEFLNGEEMSFFVICDGKNLKNFGTAQDHKRALEGDKGKNTGGMGSYSPSRLINKHLEKKILNKIIKPTLKGLADIGISYKGFLYAGLMIVKNEPYLIEYNVRMGDPECQTLLPMLDSDLAEILMACCEDRLTKTVINWKNKKSLCIVLCSKGYPDKFEKNKKIKNLEKIKLEQDNYIFHAGTKISQNEIYSIGGRVLNFVSLSNDFYISKKNILKNIKDLNWDNGYYRRDIGYKVIK